jgi:transcription termination factor Rho
MAALLRTRTTKSNNVLVNLLMESQAPHGGEPAAPKKKRAAKARKTAEPADTGIEPPSAPAKKSHAARPRAQKHADADTTGQLPLGDNAAPPEPTPPPPAPAPAPAPAEETPAPAGRRQLFRTRRQRAATPAPAAPQTGNTPASEPAARPETPRDDAPPAPPAPPAAGAPSAPSSAADAPPANDTAPAPDAPTASGEQTASDTQPPQNGNGQHPHEPYWKKKKRDKFAKKHGKWQPQGGGQPKHPTQPPPPNLQPAYGDLPPPDRFADPAALDALAAEITAPGAEPIYLDQLYALTLAELTASARIFGAAFEGAPNRKQLLAAVFKHAAESKIPIIDRGYIDLTDRGHGFIVHANVNYRLYPENSYLPASFVTRYGLKRGHQVEVLVQAPRENERCPAVVRIDKVMGGAPGEISKVTPFEELTPYYPLKRILLEAPGVHKDVSMRAVDILTPIGFGQRGLIVAPPRTGKTVILQNLANSISANFPGITLIILLIDERPEEVTDFRRHTTGEVVSSTFDEAPENHVHCAEMVGEKARRLVEAGQHVVILLDSITRLARAYNALASNSGKIMSGGMEATALQKPKRFFGAARNIEGGGSLTIMGTALIDTGSRMDEVIFEEFKGTGNMELHLDRGLVEKRIFPAINIDRSGTRKEELIYHPDEMQRIYGLRRAMQGIPSIDAMESLLKRLKQTKTNAEFLMSLNR